MPISDRTRKILWGRSGNRCAICRNVLVADPSPTDPASVVGEECHINAQSPGGPRWSETASAVDSEDNLILLCRVDHKRVDDQPIHYTPDRLRSIKVAHESWVHATLSSEPPAVLPVAIRRANSRPLSLSLVSDGSQLLDLVIGAMGYDFDNDEPKNEEELELLAGFLQELQDYGEIGDDLEAAGRVKARFALGKALVEVAEAGYLVYGGRDHHVIEGGVLPPSNWMVAAIRVKRVENVINPTPDPSAPDPATEESARAT